MLNCGCCYVPLSTAEVVADNAAVVSGMLGKCHKFVVCTSPRSRLKHSSTDAPTELRRVTIEETIVHLFCFGSYFSTEFNDDEPSLPPSAYNIPSTSTTSCVDL